MIGLVDGNNFYVSCERIFDLSLLGRPVGVLSNNDGCLISRSNEMKALGIAMGAPFYQLKPLISRYGLVFKSSNYELYGDISRRLIAALYEFTPDVEQYSIDEAFIEVRLSESDGDFDRFGRKLRAALLQWIGIPCGIGFAPTRTLAKIANHIGKKLPDGVYVMPDDPAPVLASIPVVEVWGVGRRLAPKLEKLGIRTAGLLAAADENLLRREFGVQVARTALELRGVPAVEAVNPQDAAKSVSCSRSFGHPVTELGDLAEAVASYTARAAEKLRGEKLLAAGINVYFEYFAESRPVPLERGFSGTTVTFPSPTADTAAMLGQIGPKLKGIFLPGRRYKKAGVLFFGLESAVDRQLDLFSPAARSDRDERLAAAVDELNRKFGRNTVIHLAEGLAKPWAMKRDLLSPSYTTRWDQLLAVR
ncbi:MAG: Y-family DNA polymerase [Victivallaceae bacterium]